MKNFLYIIGLIVFSLAVASPSFAATNAACGSASGGFTASTPTTGLCASGTASAISGNSTYGPWNWLCLSPNGGNNASCQSYLGQNLQPAAANGACGSSNGVAVSSAPSSNLCTVGTASTVSGNGPWNWGCNGSNGGSTAQCSAPVKAAQVNGACGSTNGMALSSVPSTGLCTTGTASGVSGNGPWTWNCNGSNGGSNASCQATQTATAINGACGSSSGQTLSSIPSANLCTAGSASSVAGSGPWSWICAGTNGGTTATCQATKTASTTPTTATTTAACGSANGGFTASTPTTGLCASGTASAISGNSTYGPWNWLCLSPNGGNNASCQSYLGQNLQPAAANGACGSSNGVAVSSAPSSGLCAAGNASGVSGNGPWNWSCTGSNGGAAAQCSALVKVAQINGVCGSSNGQTFSSTPANNFCTAGNASGVSGNGPWAWSCAGTNGGTTAQCSASVAAAQVNGVCGSSNGQTFSSTPANNFCTAGAASAVSGNGPWAWSCIGGNGGATAQCSALIAGQAFYVSPTGNDSNSGQSSSAPFKTLERAQAAMEAQGTASYTTYLMGGTYPRTQTFNLTNNSDQNKSWIAYPGQTPVLDGGNTAAEGFYITESGVTIQGLTIQNFTVSGIHATWANNIVVDNNRILNITSPDWRTGVIGSSVVFLRVQNSSITHNLINGNTEEGIQVNAGGAGDNNSNDTVAYNEVYNTCTLVNDCGAIYFRDVPHVSTGQVINANIIGGYGPNESNSSKAIYLDDETSNVTITNNIVYGTGQYGLQIHGGNNNVFKNNIFDVTHAQALGLYQDDVGSGGVNYGMGGNVFEQNIVYSSGAPVALWDYINQTGGSIALPTVSENLYYAVGGSFSNSGTIVDNHSVIGNPGFVDEASSNYNFNTTAASQTIGFQAINQAVIGPQ